MTDERPNHRVGACAVALILGAALTGCTAPPDHADAGPSPAPSPSQEDQDAAAFGDVYSKYVSIPLDSETEGDLAHVLTGRALDDDLTSLQHDENTGHRITGEDVFTGFKVTDRGTDPQGAEYMTAQTCLDVSGTRIIDRDGHDVTPSRDERLSLQMKAIRVADGSWRISDFVRNDDVHACA